MAEGTAGANYRLSATLDMQDQMSGKLKSAVSQLKSVDSAVSKLGGNSEVSKLAKRLDALSDLRKQVNEFKELKKSVAATQAAYNQANSETAQLARQYKQGQNAVAQMKARQDELRKTFEKSQTASAQLKNQLSSLKSEAAKIKNSGAKEEYQKLQNQIKSTYAELKASQSMTRQAGADLKTLAGGVKQAQRELGNIGNAFEQSKNKAARLKQELKTQQPVLNEMRQKLLSQGFNTRDFVASERRLREQTATAARDLYTAQRQQQIRETLSRAGMKLSGGNVNVNVGGNATSKLGAIRKELQSITQKTWNVAVNAKNAVGGKINDFANGAMLGMGAQMLGTAGVGYGLIDSVQTYRNFEKQITRNVALATPGMTREESSAINERFSAAARYYGATTPLTAEQVGKAQEYAIIAGWDADKILGKSFKNGDVNPVMGAEGALKPIIQASIASGEDLALVSDIITDSMTAMGYKAGTSVDTLNGKFEATQHFVDTLMKTTVSANTNFQQLGLAMKYAAPLAHTAGYSIEDMSVALGLMANNGIKADQAGTGMRGILNRFINEPKKAAEAFDTLGISMEDTNGKIKGFMPLMMEVRSKLRAGDKNINAESMMDFMEKTTGETIENREEVKAALEKIKSEGGLSKKEMMRLGSSMSGTYALSAFMALINSDDEDIKTLMEKVYNSHGTTQEMFDKMSQTLDFDIESFKSAFADLQIEFMTGNGGQGLRNFFQGLTEDVNYFKNSLKDGFDIGDIGGVVSRVVTQLKNKFLEFDGIGSILAGGALAMGLKKIYSLTMQLKNAAMSMKNWYKGTSVSSTIPPNRTTGGVTSSVGSMVVHANSVVVNGKAVAQNGATSTTSRNGTSSTTTSRNTTSTTAASTASKLSGLAKAAGGTAVLTGIFSIMDLIATRSTNADRISEAQSVYDEAQEQYKLIAKDSKRSEELPSATEKLQKATSDLKAVQKEVVQHNNESLFGGGGAVAGAAAGAAVGSAILPGIGTLVGSILGGIGGSELGKELGKKFDYDVLGWLTGKNGKTSATTKADWKLDDGRMFSELSAKERIGYKESASEKIRRETSQNAVVQQVKDQKRDDYLESFKKGEVGDFALSKVKEEDIDAAVAASVRKKEQQRLGMNNAVVKQTPVVASMYGDKNSKEISNITNKNLLESFFEKIGKIVQNDSAVKRAAEKPKTESLSAVDVGNSGLNPVTGQMITLPTMPNFGLPDFNIGAKIQNEIDFVSNKFDELKNSLSEKWTNFNISDMLPDFNLSQWLSEKTSEMPDFSQMWSDFSVSDMLPDFNLSQWLSERTSELSSIDLTSMLPDFSTIGTSISETFSQIPTAASEAFNTISTYANDGLTTIQTAWNELPGFFGGLFSGLGEVASGAGTAIASGINSGIGMIQSAWESLSGWLSAKISSLSSMASSAAAKIGINIGHNATGTASWRGGFTEINEHGGEIIDLPSGTRIYPHATTMKMLQDEFKNGKLDGLIQSEEFNSLSKNFAQVGDLNFQAMSTFPPSDLSAFPQAFQFDRWANSVVDNSSSTTNNSNSSSNLNGVTVTGNTFNVRQESDINEIAFRLLSLITDEHANYAGA